MRKNLFNIVVLASSDGGNFEIALKNQNTIGYMISKLIVDRECGAIEKAEENSIEYIMIERKNQDYMTQQLLDTAIIRKHSAKHRFNYFAWMVVFFKCGIY